MKVRPRPIQNLILTLTAALLSAGAVAGQTQTEAPFTEARF
jgi:hypothetical protein